MATVRAVACTSRTKTFILQSLVGHVVPRINIVPVVVGTERSVTMLVDVVPPWFGESLWKGDVGHPSGMAIVWFQSTELFGAGSLLKESVFFLSVKAGAS